MNKQAWGVRASPYYEQRPSQASFDCERSAVILAANPNSLPIMHGGRILIPHSRGRWYNAVDRPPEILRGLQNSSQFFFPCFVFSPTFNLSPFNIYYFYFFLLFSFPLSICILIYLTPFLVGSRATGFWNLVVKWAQILIDLTCLFYFSLAEKSQLHAREYVHNFLVKIVFRRYEYGD